ncbi:MAG TPA: putative sulfate exporter family transporter [Bryobacteraceae bacterium]|nr:putative sulfate exporter family transporter [Bryobacteraceae bacterium]
MDQNREAADNSFLRTSKLLFVLAAVVSLVWCSPPVALGLGLAIGLMNWNPWRKITSRLSKLALKISVVGLGFGMNPSAILHTGKTSFVYTAVGVTAVMCLGWAAGRLLSVPFNSAFLIAAGTAICGGSAIAAVSPVISAREEEAAVSFSTVFILNSIALVLFPFIGVTLGLSQTQFGLWSALAIQDMSSVVGAGIRYGGQALLIGTTVKLVRSLWIVPLVISSALLLRTRAKVSWPWFILFFLGAAGLTVTLPGATPLWTILSGAAKAGFSLTLFLIGSGISRKAVREMGWRPMAMGVLLWLIVSTVTLSCIDHGWISL